MKRYFDAVGKRLALEVELSNRGTPLTTAQIGKHYGMKLREVDRKTFNKLCKEYQNK